MSKLARYHLSIYHYEDPWGTGQRVKKQVFYEDSKEICFLKAKEYIKSKNLSKNDVITIEGLEFFDFQDIK